jgi:type I restriction enzyme S subunit
LRFPEFDGEWKSCILGNAFNLYSGNTPDRFDKQQFTGDINWVTSGELKSHYLKDTKEKITGKASKKYNLKILSPGTFVIAIYGLEATGIRGTGSIILKNSTISQACMAFSPTKAISNEFLYCWYKKHGDIIGLKYAQGTKQQNLGSDIINNFRVDYPSINEQKKLERFISIIDFRIEIQNAIIDDLKKLRSSVIDNILSCNHNKNLMQPTVKKRLKDIGEYIRGLTYSIDEVSTNGKGIVVMRANNIDDGEPLNYKTGVITVDKNINTKQLLRKGDVVICMANGSSQLVGKNSVYDGESRVPITVGAFCGIFRSDYLLSQWITQTRKYRRHIYQAIQGGNGAIANIIGEDILDVPFIMPSNRQEPIILSLLISIDNKINNEIAILEKQKEKKLFLLNNMFI